MDNNPFKGGRGLNAPQFGLNTQGGNRDLLNATAVSDKADLKKIKARQAQDPIPVLLPPHIFPNMPLGCQPLDFRKLCNVLASSTKVNFMSFTAPEGSRTVIQAYAIFSDALNASLSAFIPEVDGNRVFPYHGDPTDNFKMSLGLSPDISNNALIPAQLILEPRQTITWFVTNTDTVDVAMGVRMVGYFDSSARRVTPRFGG
jgi:hypothetical protein